MQQDSDLARAELAALRNENERLQGSLITQTKPQAPPQKSDGIGKPIEQQPTNILATGSSQFEPNELPRDSWNDAGFATPEAALKTRGWAVLNNNRERFAESVSITPGARKLVEDMIVQMASVSTDPDKDRLIQEALKNKWGVEEAILMPLVGLNQEKGFTGYRILSQRPVSVDEVILELETQMTSAAAEKETLKFRRFGDNWKVVIDEDTVKPGS